MGKLQAIHKLTVKPHRINLEVEFIVERLAPEARPVAVRVNDCRILDGLFGQECRRQRLEPGSSFGAISSNAPLSGSSITGRS